ncbi:L-fuculokinase [Agromyces sp. NPDC058484]|uniref:FGGY-family carbohydrate kinase n=1 Tax=Agromyces sp. NPDC058484 TaxID=3346524 RepID=UPI00364B6486
MNGGPPPPPGIKGFTSLRSDSRTPVACGVDVGSTNIKVVAVDAEGSVVARASRPTPRGAEGLSIDVETLAAALQEMVAGACGVRYEVHSVCAAGVGEDGLLVDAQLRPLTPALAWFDPRRQGIFRRLRPHLHDDDLFDTDSDPARTIIGWEWARTRIPPGRARYWIGLADLPAVLWTDVPFMSDTLASRTGAWHSGDRRWASDRVELTLGSADLLPTVLAVGEIVGDLRSTALLEAGAIARDAVVVAGGHDHPVGGWGVDQMDPGVVLDSMGTAEVVVAQSRLPVGLPRRRHVDIAPGIQSHGTTLLRVEELTRNVEWASQDPQVARHIRALLDGRVAPAAVLDSGAFLPGRRGGGRPSYSVAAPRDPFARASAVLGALARSGRDAVEAVRSLAEGSGVRLAGGWARSPGWVSIKETINGYRAEPILEPEVTAVSAALLAARARGWTPDPVRALSGRSAVGRDDAS